MRRPVLLAAIALTACPAEPDDAPTPAEPRPSVVVTPDFIDLGEVVMDPPHQRVLIANTGAAPLEILGLDVFPRVGFALDPIELPTTLEAGTEQALRIRFQGEEDGVAAAVLAVVTDDWSNPRVEVPLTADVLAPRISLTPATTDFGSLMIGCTASRTLEIENLGRAPLVLGEVWMEDLAADGEMSLMHGLADGQTLQPGQIDELHVHYVPHNVEPATAVVHVESSDPRSPHATATLSGLAHALPEVVDTFVQLGARPADVLFVDEAPDVLVPSEFEGWFDYLALRLTDFHVAAVSADPAEGGALLTPVLDPSSVDPGAALTDALTLAGGASAGGFDAVQRCFGNSVDGCGAGFDRGDGSRLHVVFLSDTADASTSLPGPATFVPWLQGLRTDPADVVVSTISGGTAGCVGFGWSADPSPEYVDAAILTGGVVASLCSGSQAAALWLFAGLVVPQGRFELSDMPLLASIRVTVDGAAVTGGWTYEPALGTIFFDPAAVPPQGAVVEVAYVPLGDFPER